MINSTLPDDIAGLLKKATLNTVEAGQLLELHPATIARLFDEGKLRGWRTSDAPKSRIKLETSSVVEFAAKSQGRILRARRG